jgi:hypothetical protein
MKNQELYKQAIADAKSLKEISMAQAKQAIAEAFNPKIQEMFRLKLSELEEDELKEDVDNMEEGYEDGEDGKMKESEEVNEMTLEEILAELEEGDMEEGDMEDGHMEEMETGYSHGKQKPAMEEAEEEEEVEIETGEEEGEDDMESEEGAEEVAELSVEEFKDLIRDVIADVMSGGVSGEEDLEGLEGDEEEVIGLDEILAELEGEDKMEEAKKKDDTKELKAELHEAIKTINSLKNSLNEINLLNAKLLYVNKIFKAKTLTESQKVKVVNAFDRASTTKEAQNIYETLKDSLGETKKQSIKESVGFASKAMGKAPVKPIVESDAYVSRLQILAGIKKAY